MRRAHPVDAPLVRIAHGVAVALKPGRSHCRRSDLPTFLLLANDITIGRTAVRVDRAVRPGPAHAHRVDAHGRVARAVLALVAADRDFQVAAALPAELVRLTVSVAQTTNVDRFGLAERLVTYFELVATVAL